MSSFNGSAVKLNPADNGSLCAKVTLRETVTITEGHEMRIQGKINKHSGMRGLSIIESENSGQCRCSDGQSRR